MARSLRVKILLDREKPKVAESEVARVIEQEGMNVAGGSADIGVVVGGDGVFGLYGRTETIPLLFVGVRSDRPTGSKAYLAATYFDELNVALRGIRGGAQTVREYKRLKVLKNGKKIGETFTDVYLQRGIESRSLRYRIRVDGDGQIIDELAIGDGVTIATTAGATGYYSYPDKIIDGKSLSIDAHSTISEDEVGICHILPSFTQRTGGEEHPLRYTVPWGSKIELSLTRPADARLYGVAHDHGGVRVTLRDKLSISPSELSTKVIEVRPFDSSS